MSPHILHIYGPMWINWYGAMIAFGVIIFSYCFLHDKRRQHLMATEIYFDLLTMGIIGGIIGGRLLYFVEHLTEFHTSYLEVFVPWVGGFSVLGTILSMVIIIPVMLYRRSIPILPTVDLAALYAPLLQAIARIGCLFAGCCFGKEISAGSFFALYYTHPDSLAPLHTYVHPTQLYSCLFSFALFLVLRFVSINRSLKPGLLSCFYLLGEAFARFSVDFLRGDRGELYYYYFSFSQGMSLVLGIVGFIGIIILSSSRTHKK